MAKQKIDYDDEHIFLPTIEEFLQAVRGGWFTDYDGFGCYATKDYFDFSCQFDFANPENHPEWATHINWFNR